MSHPKGRKPGPTVKQSKVRADNAQLVRDWASRPESAATRAAFAPPQSVTSYGTETSQRKREPEPLPFGRGPALLDEIRNQYWGFDPGLFDERWYGLIKRRRPCSNRKAPLSY